MNAVPVTLLDIRLQPGAVFAAHLPASYNGFVVAIEGEAQAGATAERLAVGTVGWTEPMGEGDSVLGLTGGDAGARLLLYAGQPQDITVAARGPFIAGSAEELAGYYSAYRHGKFLHAGTMRPTIPTSTVPADQAGAGPMTTASILRRIGAVKHRQRARCGLASIFMCRSPARHGNCFI